MLDSRDQHHCTFTIFSSWLAEWYNYQILLSMDDFARMKGILKEGGKGGNRSTRRKSPTASIANRCPNEIWTHTFAFSLQWWQVDVYCCTTYFSRAKVKTLKSKKCFAVMNTYLHTNQKCQFLQKWNLSAKSWNAFDKTVSFAHPLNDRPLPRNCFYSDRTAVACSLDYLPLSCPYFFFSKTIWL